MPAAVQTAAVTAVHLATVAGCVRPEGRGIVAFDIFGSGAVPELQALEGADSAALHAFVEQKVKAGVVRLDWNPAGILERLKSRAMSTLVQSPQLTGPWLWDTGKRLVVYALVFDRPSAQLADAPGSPARAGAPEKRGGP